MMLCLRLEIFFFKTQTAYLLPKCLQFTRVLFRSPGARIYPAGGRVNPCARTAAPVPRFSTSFNKLSTRNAKIGRASCRERVLILQLAVKPLMTLTTVISLSFALILTHVSMLLLLL